MRRLAPLLLLTALCLTAGPARAQTSLHAQGGTALPVSPNLFTEASAPGVALEVGPSFALADRLRLITTLGHSRFPTNSTFLSDPEALTITLPAPKTLTVWSLAADLRIQLRPSASRLVPYVTVGASANRLNHTPERADVVCFGDVIAPPCPMFITSNDNPEVRLGLLAGLGVSARVMPALRLFVQSEYAGLFSEDDTLRFVPLQLGLQFHPFR